MKHVFPRRLAAVILTLTLAPGLFGCAGNMPGPESTSAPPAPETAAPVIPATTVPAASDPANAVPDNYDSGVIEEEDFIDISAAEATAAYSVLFLVAVAPENYEGKTLRLRGDYKSYYDAERDIQYMACFLSDATACCSQSIYMVMDDPPAPDALPPDGSVVTAEGVVERYVMEDGTPSVRLVHTEILAVETP